MSGISSGVGLISGIDTASLISQLIALEARPLQTLQRRVGALDVQRTAFIELSAQLLSAQNAALRFNGNTLFRAFTANSSNENLLTASTSESATPGSHTFRVRSLVSTSSLLSRGFANADVEPVGAGTITIEVGRGAVTGGTELSTLNGGQGIRRGTISITDRSGTSADIDLSAAVTIDDVLDAINSQRDVNVRARVTGISEDGFTGDRIVLEDLTGLETGRLIVADQNGGFTAADLGIAGDTQSGRIDGRDLVRLTDTTPLGLLNDGNGVGRAALGAGDDLLFTTTFGSFSVSLSDRLESDTDLDALNNGRGVRLGVIRITDRSGQSTEVDLSGARNAQDVVDLIEASGAAVSVAITDSNFQIRDTSQPVEQLAENLIIEDVSGHAAADLGITANVNNDVIAGRSVYRVTTLGDVILAINLASNNNGFVQASISADGKGITLTALGFQNSVTVTAEGNSTALRDLGLSGATVETNTPFESRRLIAGLNTVLLQSLNGGNGVDTGTVRFTDQQGRTADIDFSQAATLQDVIDLINNEPTLSLTASVSAAGSGIVIRDDSDGSGSLTIEDVAGTLAGDLRISTTPGGGTTATAGVVESGNLQRQYVTRRTELTDFFAGGRPDSGQFRITDSTGAVHTIVIGANLITVGDVIDQINLRTPGNIEARINATGDGIVIVDNTNGSDVLKVEDINGGRLAADLRLAGQARHGENFIDGSMETRIDISANDTLNDVVAKINAAGGDFSASVLSDGGSNNPFSLVLTSAVSGRRGSLVIDTSGMDLGLETLSRGQDAVVTVGGDGAPNAIVISSSSNTIENAIDGVTLNLVSASDEEVTISVAQDVDGIVDAVQSFVDAYNAVQSSIDEKTSFNQETEQRGPLFGDPTVNLVRSRLQRMITREFDGFTAQFSRLFAVGIRLGANHRLEFDAERFRESYDESPELVEELFTREETGLGAVFETTLTELTRDFDGVLSRRDNLLADRQELLNDRIDRLNVQLNVKRARLEAQFVGLESALAALQNQQAALGSLAFLTR